MSNNKDFKVKNGILPTSYQEGLGTVVSAVEGYSISSASYDSVSFSVSSQDTSPKEMFFKPDGTKMYVLGGSGGDVNEYNLSTAWDISTASYLQNFSVSGQESNPEGMFFKPDGTIMYITGGSGQEVNEYSLSTAWNISTASYTRLFSVSAQEADPKGVFFKADGFKMYIVGAGGGFGNLYEYSLSTAWNISTSSYSRTFDISTQETSPEGIFLKPDGTELFVVGGAGDKVYKYDLSTAWNISTLSYSQDFSVSAQEGGPKGVFFKSDGAKMYVVGSSSDTIYQYSTAINTNSLDLSTGSVFDLTPTSDAQVTLSNPAASGTVSQATLLLGSEDAAGVSSTFSTTLYTGTGAAHTIDNGLDLAGDGGLVWIKNRGSAAAHALYDSERGLTYQLSSNTNGAQIDYAGTGIASFNSNGFTSGTDSSVSASGSSFVTWSFKKQAKFFDVVTYTGDGTSGRSISHNLGSVPGIIMVKKLSAAASWMVYHVGSHPTSPEQYWLELDNDNPRDGGSSIWNNTAPTDAVFTVGSGTQVNQNNATYVAYLFAHDTDASSIIKCGSYTGTDGAHDITLGFEPQWILFKRSNSAASWLILDNVRGLPISGGVNQASLSPNEQTAEYTNTNYGVAVNSTGFSLSGSSSFTNDLNDTYIYMAIRNPYVPTITYDPTLEWPGGTAPTAPATGETDVITFNTSDGGTTYSAVQAIDGAK